MEPTGVMQAMPFKKDPWQGQRRVFESLDEHKGYLNIQLPTGYGKTFTAAGCYAIKQREGSVNRLLMIFPTDAQLRQFCLDSQSDASDLVMAAVQGPRVVVDVRYFGGRAIERHRNNTAQIFAITAQSLIQARGDDNIRMLMQTGRWMVVVDEYHHYGIEKAWGLAVRSLPATFMLAMSATPSRPDDDSAFGRPHIQYSYREAAKEKTVKPLRAHAYHYRIDALDQDGNVQSFTTRELTRAAGDSPEAIERWRIERKMRWSPKYISPLVYHPIERLYNTRLQTGQPVQALFGAMCVSHAELACTQIRAMYPELRVDWVGTGINGRSDDANKDILQKFCPQKDASGVRKPTLDVLVHVGIAGEGLDSTHVTEVVHLNGARRNNSNDQENGRAARRLMAADGSVIEGHINFDATSDYTPFVGLAIQDAMDGLDAPREIDDDEPHEHGQDDYQPSPDEPVILICNMELDHIDSGDPGVQRMANVFATKIHPSGWNIRDFSDQTSPKHQEAIAYVLEAYRAMRRAEAEATNDQSVVMQWNDNVGLILSRVVGLILRKMGGLRPIEKSLAGDVKRRINTRKKAALGEVSKDVELLKQHYRWLVNLEKEILADGVPMWLW